MATRKRSAILPIGILIMLFVIVAWPFVSAVKNQQQAIAGLTDAARNALTLRGGGVENTPAFSVHERSAQWLEEIAGPTYFGRVSDVIFRQSDDQQILESIPHLQSLIALKRVMFYSIPSKAVILELRDSLPSGVMLVDENGDPLP